MARTQQLVSDDDIAEAARIQAAQAAKAAERARVAKELKDARLREELEAKAEADRVNKENERAEWEKTKKLVESRQAAAAAEEQKMDAGAALLTAIERMATLAVDHAQHEQRAEKLKGVLGDTATNMAKRSRKRSKELTEMIADMMDGALESAFRQFDSDGSGSLDADELESAYRAAGIEIGQDKLRQCMRMMDTNNDGVIDLEEFKAMAVQCKTME